MEQIKPKLDLFPCPRCGKQLTEKGLRYSHKCPADKVIKQPEQLTAVELSRIANPVAETPFFS